MVKRSILTLLLTLAAAVSFAQERKISGTLIDGDSKEPLPQVTLQLLKMDSTFVGGAVSDEEGKFSLTAPENAKYLLKLTSVGYITALKRIEMVDDHDLAMGTVVMNSDAIMLKGAEVTALAQKVVLREDTFIYNSAAYRVPEGSVAEELVRRLPGAQIDDDGKITINGKEVKKIKVDGREFMTGDTQTAMKNLPTSIIENIKVYDEKSDLTRITGIEDGEEETTLDFTIKRGMNKGFMSNTDLAIGTKKRYSARGMGMYTKDALRVQLMGSANNTGDQEFGGRGGGPGRGNNGLNASKMLGVNFNYEKKDPKTNKDKLELSGSLRWNHRDGDALTRTASQNFVARTGAYSNSINQNYSRSNSWNGQMKVEWKPDSMWNINFRPNLSFSKSDGRSWSQSASFNEDPYEYATDPLEQMSLIPKEMKVNWRRNQGISYSDTKQVGGRLQVNRKLNTKGRNVTLRAEASYNEGDSKNFSTSTVDLYQVMNAQGADSIYQRNRFSITPSKRHSYSLQATYSEPILEKTYLQFSYRYQYSRNKSDRATYDFSNVGESIFDGLTPYYRAWDDYLSRLEKPYEDYRNTSLSRYSEYKNHTHNIELTFRMVRDKYNLTAGVMMQPQRSNFIQNYQGIYVDTTRTVFNVSPTLNFRYKFSKVSTLRIDYRGTTQQPSISQLLDIYDDSDPLNISRGNPGLKPSFTQSLNLFYNGYQQHYMRTWMTFLRFSTTNNSISSMVTYDEKTGGRTTRPENINGNWNIHWGGMFNTAIDSAGVWNINTFPTIGYNNHVGYVTLDRTSSSQKNTTRETTIGNRLGLSFRPNLGTWLAEFELDGNVNYSHARNKLQEQANLDTWVFSYGGSINITAPWGTSIAMNIHERSRRGYDDKSMNTNELLWNAQISQTFLKGRNLSVMLQFYDILHQQSNFSRMLDAWQRRDTWYNSINSYAMLHVVYQFNVFGGKQGRDRMMGPDGPDAPPEGGPRGGNRPNGGGPRGGFGGGFGRPRF
ncbi:MAG: outer membrane beta-barrel protein [Prevotella sp.]|nr:outer membrane beta-barrel protein [Prevotella sp.]